MAEDYYEILGVKKDASKEDIQKSYRKLAMDHHPDRGGDAEKFKEISEAYGVLSNDQKRAEYDSIGKSGIHERYSEEDIYGGSDLEDMLRGMGFGGFGIHEMFRENRENRRVVKAKGEDIHGTIELSLEEVLNGTTKKVKYARAVVCKECSGVGAKEGDYTTCPPCGGEGSIMYAQRTLFGTMVVAQECDSCRGNGKLVSRYCPSCSGEGIVNKIIEDDIKIDAGVKDGIAYSKKGAGNEAPNRDAGDLYIDISVREHPVYKRKDDDLIAEKVIPFSYAALGGKVDVDYFSKKIRINVPQCTQGGTYLRIKGKGLPHFRSSGSGDLMVRIDVKTPENLTEKQKELFEQLRKYE